MKTCNACGQFIRDDPPDYPVTCAKCGVTYGPGGELPNHRPGSAACNERQEKNAHVRTDP